MKSLAGQFARQPPHDDLAAASYSPQGNRCVSVEEGYARWAPTYDDDPNPLLVLEERQLRCLLPRLQGKRLLDLACGTGRWLAWMLAQGASAAVGVDSSAAMLMAAKRKPALRDRLVQADCRAIPFARASFDLVILSLAVGHVRDVESVAREVGRVSAAGADVYVSDLHPLAYVQGWNTGFRDGGGRVEITTWPRSVQQLLAAWMSGGFDCVQSIECRLSEAERPIFAQAGKPGLFEEACRVPAVLLCHLRRLHY